MTSEASIADLLRSRGAEDIDHPGGTLYAHLERVQRRLARLGAPELVQLAARTHAVYGTDGLDITLLSLDERPLLAEVIGTDAEQLVYRYGACDRNRTWDTIADTATVWNRFTGTSEVLGQADLQAFTDLSLVNELDVAEHAPGFLDQHGDYFRQLTETWAPLLSPSVHADGRRVFG
jgi:hypothetical protein